MNRVPARPAAASDTPLLHVDGVSKSFGELRAVDDVRFDVHPGEVHGFLGPNGAGKTTTLRMILEIIRPDRGRVLWSGGETIDRRRIGYLPEERGLFEDAGVLETLVYLGSLRGMSRGAARAAGTRWLERMGLADRAAAKVGTLSKGNQQKVQMAGAILHDPALAVLDEPFSGLDPINQELFIEIIREMRARGVAVLLSAHQLNLVERLCDRFTLIAQGRIVLEGTLDAIRRRTAGGASEVLAIDLHLPPGQSAEAAVSALRAVALEPQCRVREGGDGTAQLEVPLQAGTDLAPLLAALAGRFGIARVQMRALSLHEIYIQAVTAQPAAGSPESPGPPDGANPKTERAHV